MTESPLSPAEQTLAAVMRIYAGLYFGFLAALLVFEEQVFALMEWQRELYGFGRPIGLPSEPFWKFVAASLVLSYALISFWASQDIRNSRHLVRLQVWGKFFSTALFFCLVSRPRLPVRLSGRWGQRSGHGRRGSPLFATGLSRRA